MCLESTTMTLVYIIYQLFLTLSSYSYGPMTKKAIFQLDIQFTQKLQFYYYFKKIIVYRRKENKLQFVNFMRKQDFEDDVRYDKLFFPAKKLFIRMFTVCSFSKQFVLRFIVQVIAYSSKITTYLLFFRFIFSITNRFFIQNESRISDIVNNNKNLFLLWVLTKLNH